jgi:hypothetical protein
MQQEFTEIFDTLRDITASFAETQQNIYEYLEEKEDTEESKFYKELNIKIQSLKIHENALKKTREEIELKIKELYVDTDAKYKDDKRKLVALQLERERIELNRLKQ